MSMQVADPFDTATAAGERQPVFYGQIDLDVLWVVLEKGRGKVPWLPAMGQECRRTEVTVHLNPLDVSGLTRMIDRSIIAESREWTGTVWPSLRGLGLTNLRELQGKFVKVELVKSGRSWTNREGKTVEGTTFKFLALYADQAAAEAAYHADFGTAEPEAPASNGTAASNGAGPADATDIGRAAALQFLPALVLQAGKDRDALAALLASMPVIAKYFTIDSPEVVALLGA